jgi:Leucine-rich repeat (LRR) protein
MVKTLLTVLLGAYFSFSSISQNKTALQGQILKSDGSAFANQKTFLVQAEKKVKVDSTMTDANGEFHFENFAYGKYSIWINDASADNAAADVIGITSLNPAKRNQHFKIDDGSLVNTESNYSDIKAALGNSENVFMLRLNSLQHDVVEKSLIISTDGIKKLSPRIGEFINLETLEININGITFLPAELGKLKKLTTLSANLNKLSTLPPEMGDLKNLIMLDLGKNNFMQFPGLITQFTGLEVLNFESNPIKELPATINALKNLKELDLSNCFDLTALPPQISELSNLETLNLSKCGKLKFLPEGIINLKSLKLLDVSGTKISTKDFQKAVPGCEVRR